MVQQVQVARNITVWAIIEFVDSSSSLIVFMVRWFEEILEVPRENIRLRLYLYPNDNIQKNMQFWSDTTGLPLRQFLECQVDSRRGRKQGSGTLSHGTVHLTINALGDDRLGSYLARKIAAWKKEILVEV